MKVIKAIFRFYIESSIHVALAICALAGVSVIRYNLDWRAPVFIFLFLASVTGYNFVKYAGVAKLHHRSLTNQLKSIQIFSLLCFLGLIYSISLQSMAFMTTTAILGIITFFYAVPFFPGHKNLRQFKSLKIFIIALVWAGAALWLPLIDQRSIFTWSVLLDSLAYFLFTLALILPFEIRDLKYDKAKLGTLPQRIGIKKTKSIGDGLLIGFVLLKALSDLDTYPFIISVAIAVLIRIFINYSFQKQAPYYASFWVEAVPIFWFLLLWLPTLL